MVINGKTISATVPLSDFPVLNIPTKLDPQHYTWNLWPEYQLQVKNQISDFAPDEGNAKLTIVPEPATALQAIAGLVIAGFAGLLKRNPRGSLMPLTYRG